jgi:hypothetical protein
MTALTLRPIPAPSSIFATLLERHRALATYGLIMLALGVAAVTAQAIDTRTLNSGVGVWVKPAKFFFSVSVFALTAAWFFGYVRPERRRSRPMRVTASVLIGTGTFELAYICWQAAHGVESHFNTSTPFYTAMYALMGIAAVFLVGTTLPLAWEISRRPAAGLQRSFVAAVVIGLVLTFVLGGGLGGYMSSQMGHSVGPVGGHVLLFGWNRLGGDLRVAHFLGIHAEQAIPILAALTGGVPARARWTILTLGALAYCAITLAVFAEAVAGRALIPD